MEDHVADLVVCYAEWIWEPMDEAPSVLWKLVAKQRQALGVFEVSDSRR